jgi:hypothetical protein
MRSRRLEFERGKITQRRCGIENARTLLRLLPERLPLANSLASHKALRVFVAVTPYYQLTPEGQGDRRICPGGPVWDGFVCPLSVQTSDVKCTSVL